MSEVTLEQRVGFLERYHQTQGNTISLHTDALNAMKIEAARQEGKDANLIERIERLEKAVNKVYGLGWWILAAFGGSLIALISNFLFRGGFVV